LAAAGLAAADFLAAVFWTSVIAFSCSSWWGVAFPKAFARFSSRHHENDRFIKAWIL
jgi:hypothetical protein